MKYLNRKTLDLEIRLNHELNNTKNANFISLEINSDSKDYIKLLLLVKDIEETNKNITSLALKRYFERYRKKYSTFPKHCLIATNSQRTNSIYIHGIIFSEHTEKLTQAWSFGTIQLEPLINKEAVSTFFVKKYIKSKVNKIHTYTSNLFGNGVYNSEIAKIITTNVISLLPNEHFEPIPFAENYYISKTGIVISKKRTNPIILKTRLYNNHIYVNLFIKNQNKSYQVAFLMAKTYLKLSETKGRYKIVHLNNQKSDNRLQNLSLNQAA